MEFLDLVEQFIKDNPVYKNDVDNFVNFIENDFMWDLQNRQRELVHAMRTDLIIKSLEHYVDTERIKKQNPARKYFVSIRQLFEFVLDKSEYSNEDLLKEFRNNTYSDKTNEFINTHEALLPGESLPVLNDNQVKVLIEWCDANFEKDYLRIPNKNATHFKRITACMCMKLMLLTGISYGIARKIKMSSLNIEESTIIINGFKIRLPRKMSTQFRQYIQAKNLTPSSDYLFSNYDGTQWGERTSASGIPGFMKTAVSETSITSIVKYRIKQLIENDINDAIIIKLTGVNKDIILDCINVIHDNEKEQYINSKLVNTKTYYWL